MHSTQINLTTNKKQFIVKTVNLLTDHCVLPMPISCQEQLKFAAKLQF